MRPFSIFIIVMALASNNAIKAQTINPDSAAIAKTLNELLTICRTVDFADPKVREMGTFYKAALYIIYRGDDKSRSWKDFANYSNEAEKEGVDQVCLKINNSVNQDTAYKILAYRTKKESEGIWYALEISYVRKGVSKKATYAFLKVNGRFGLGDIDIY